MMSQGDAINQDTMAAEAAADDERCRFCSLPAPAMVQIFTFIREAQGLTGLGVASVVCKVTNAWLSRMMPRAVVQQLAVMTTESPVRISP